MRKTTKREERSGLDAIAAGDGTTTDALGWMEYQKKMRSGSVLDVSSCPFAHIPQTLSFDNLWYRVTHLHLSLISHLVLLSTLKES